MGDQGRHRVGAGHGARPPFVHVGDPCDCERSGREQERWDDADPATICPAPTMPIERGGPGGFARTARSTPSDPLEIPRLESHHLFGGRLEVRTAVSSTPRFEACAVSLGGDLWKESFNRSRAKVAARSARPYAGDRDRAASEHSHRLLRWYGIVRIRSGPREHWASRPPSRPGARSRFEGVVPRGVSHRGLPGRGGRERSRRSLVSALPPQSGAEPPRQLFGSIGTLTPRVAGDLRSRLG